MTSETTAPARKAQLLPQLIKFGAVGAVGFVVNVIVLNVMLLIVLRNVPHADLLATAIATVVAIVVNWVGNRYWAFSEQRPGNTVREGVEFFAVSIAGMGIPLLCVWVSFYVLGFTSPIATNVAANGVGLLLGMLFRFGFYRWWVFSPERVERRRSRSASRKEASQTSLAEPALARTPDGGLVGD